MYLDLMEDTRLFTRPVTILSPQLDINAEEAGGGSCLTFRNGLFLAGPESAGARLVVGNFSIVEDFSPIS